MSDAQSPWSRRNILAVIGIVVVAAIVIVITAIATSGSSENTAHEQEPLPDFAGILLDSGAVSTIMDSRAVRQTGQWNGLYSPFAQPMDPVECNSVGSFADSWDYGDAPWRFARTHVFEEESGENLWVGETLVLFGTAEEAQEFFDRIKSEWDACDGEAYQWDGGTDRWVMQDYTATDELLVSNSRVEDATDNWKCQRAFGFRDVYVAESQVCSFSSGQAEKVVEEILAGAAG